MANFEISLSDAFMNKELQSGYTQAAYGDSFKATSVTAQELFDHITSGKAFAVGTYSGNRTKENFIQAQTIWLDLDDNVSIVDCMKHGFVKRYAFMLYPSASSSPECYKTRIGFLLDTPIKDAKQYERLVLACMEACKELGNDPSCKDSARLFYGSTNTSEAPIVENESQ